MCWPKAMRWPPGPRSPVGESESVEVVKDMGGLAAADFLRLLPHALAGLSYDIEGLRAEAAAPGRQLSIAARPLPARRIAALAVERCQVTLAFRGWPDEERLAFLARFDRTYRKGGG